MTWLRHNIGSWQLYAAAFLCYAGASMLWSPGDKIWATILLCSFILAFVLGASSISKWIIWLIYIIGITANILCVIFVADIPSGLFGNPNYFGCAVTMALAGALAYQFYWFLPVGIFGLYLSHSRGAILAAGIMSFVGLWRYSRWGAAVLALLLLPTLSLVKSGDIDPLAARLGVWQDTINHLTFFGSGFNSFFTAYQSWPVHINMTLQIPTHAYNDILEILFEFGIGAVLLWITLILILERADFGQRLICLTFFALGVTFYPIYIVPVGLLFAMTLGHATQGVSYEMASRHASPYRRASA